MKNGRIIFVFAITVLTFTVFALSIQGVSASQSPDRSVIKQKLQKDLHYGNLPLYFIKNEGQVDSRALFYAKTSGYTLWVTKQGLVFDAITRVQIDGKENHGPGFFQSDTKDYNTESIRDVHRINFQNADPDTEIIAIDICGHKVNYFIGNRKSNWKTNIPTSKAVLYRDLYPDIDLKIYGVENRIEYDFIVKPGADPDLIQFVYSGVEQTQINPEGNISIDTELGEFFYKKPTSYQIINSELIQIDSQFVYAGENTYRLETGCYNNNYAMIIDPEVALEYSTYLGGSSGEYCQGIAVESGYAYIAGYTGSADFPTKNSYHGSKDSYEDAFVTKLSVGGNTLVYSTYLGGGDSERCYSIAVESGYAYITGETDGPYFPTLNSYQKEFAGGSYDVFVTKLSTGGNALEYSTYLGGTLDEQGRGIEVESGNAYITGTTWSRDFPTENAYQNEYMGSMMDLDAFVTKLSTGGNALEYSTYFGGNDEERVDGIAVESGSVYITGSTLSPDLPTKNAYQKTHTGMDWDSYVTKFSTGGNALEFSTFFGGNSVDWSHGIDVESEYAYITGYTRSTDFPTVNAYQHEYKSNEDVFITKFSTAGNTLEYSTYIGGISSDRGQGIAVESGYAYITGETYGTDYPTMNALQKVHAGGVTDLFVTKLSPGGNVLEYSTYLGGTADDSVNDITVESGYVYITGDTDSTDFPTVNAFQKTKMGWQDGFVTKLSFPGGLTPTVTPALSPTPTPVKIPVDDKNYFLLLVVCLTFLLIRRAT